MFSTQWIIRAKFVRNLLKSIREKSDGRRFYLKLSYLSVNTLRKLSDRCMNRDQLLEVCYGAASPAQLVSFNGAEKMFWIVYEQSFKSRVARQRESLFEVSSVLVHWKHLAIRSNDTNCVVLWAWRLSQQVWQTSKGPVKSLNVWYPKRSCFLLDFTLKRKRRYHVFGCLKLCELFVRGSE